MNAIDIANVFISKENETEIIDGEGQGIESLKLEKLLFFAQELHLYKYNKPLFDDDIEAWEMGPVVRDVWNQFRGEEHIKIVPKIDYSIFTDEQLDTIEEIWEQYKDKSSQAMVEKTHNYKIWDDKYHSEIPRSEKIISQAEILDYKNKIEEYRQKAKDSVKEKFERMKRMGFAQ